MSQVSQELFTGSIGDKLANALQNNTMIRMIKTGGRGSRDLAAYKAALLIEKMNNAEHKLHLFEGPLGRMNPTKYRSQLSNYRKMQSNLYDLYDAYPGISKEIGSLAGDTGSLISKNIPATPELFQRPISKRLEDYKRYKQKANAAKDLYYSTPRPKIWETPTKEQWLIEQTYRDYFPYGTMRPPKVSAFDDLFGF